VAFEVRQYTTRDGDVVVTSWLEGLKDRAGSLRIALRLARVAAGNLGDWKSLGGGLNELRVPVGPGYRVYFSRHGKTIVLLLCGGDKKSQPTDIAKAREYLQDYKERNGLR